MLEASRERSELEASGESEVQLPVAGENKAGSGLHTCGEASRGNQSKPNPEKTCLSVMMKPVVSSKGMISVAEVQVSHSESSGSAGCSSLDQRMIRRTEASLENLEVFPEERGAEITEESDEVDVMEQNSSECPILMLPNEILLTIFSKLSDNTLINIAPVCKHWCELSKHKSLWPNKNIYYDYKPDRDSYARFLRAFKAIKYFQMLDVHSMPSEESEPLLSLLSNGPVSVKHFYCFCLAHPRVIVEFLERFKDTLEELIITISDERLSYGEGGTFKDGVKPRPGFMLKLISEMRNLRIIRFTGTLSYIARHQGAVNPKWYFGELENQELKLEAIAMNLKAPKRAFKNFEVLVHKLIIPFLRSKTPFLEELHLTPGIWIFPEVQNLLKDCGKLQAIVGFPMSCLHALETFKQQIFIDFIVAPWYDYEKIKGMLPNVEGLSHILDVSLCFCDQFCPYNVPEHRRLILQTFLPMLAERLPSCKRVHIFRTGSSRSGRSIGIGPFNESLHTTCALSRFLHALRGTLEEVHVTDVYHGGKNLPHLMKVVKETVPHLKCRGNALNRLGNMGCLFSIHTKSESVIPYTKKLRCLF
ncbi:uncharacterized protein LOC117651712 [Thrips palmi]|uniref:Uncharacterized protein LOC117651712 n=1 Tax=Thrips palmi TaxID=161013 RepID=A0A6P9A252_THRPL|nr:uncharacterized protein LOC117651712 [Thrips palmi]